jgi:hypothetical protein
LPELGTAVGRAASEGKIIHIPDVFEDKEYSSWDSQRVGGYRSVLGVMGYSRGFRETACGDGDCERRLFSPAKKLCSISTEI